MRFCSVPLFTCASRPSQTSASCNEPKTSCKILVFLKHFLAAGKPKPPPKISLKYLSLFISMRHL